MFDLTGKKALVTGASRGIGRGIALALAEQGADVAINYLSDRQEAAGVVAEIMAMGRDCFSVQADVSIKDQVDRMVGEVLGKFGRVDILVNNAGIAVFQAFQEMTEENWDRVIDTNLKGNFLCARAVVPFMATNRWGRIINLASVASGGVGFGGSLIAHYVSSKGGIIALTEALGAELAKLGIRVNAIAPGLIATEMGKMVTEDRAAAEAILARIPVGREGRPEDIGPVAVLLASNEADYITGSTIYVDGGWLAA